MSMRTSRTIIAAVLIACGSGTALLLTAHGDSAARRDSAHNRAVKRGLEREIDALAPPGVRVRSVNCNPTSHNKMTCVAQITGRLGTGTYTTQAALNAKTGLFALGQRGSLAFTSGPLAR
jgi:hypothetical protein